eukprot:s4597_g1.t1
MCRRGALIHVRQDSTYWANAMSRKSHFFSSNEQFPQFQEPFEQCFQAIHGDIAFERRTLCEAVPMKAALVAKINFLQGALTLAFPLFAIPGQPWQPMLALVGPALLLAPLRVESLCLSTGIAAEQRRSLQNSSGADIPVGILSGTWPSAPLLSELVSILINEVIGFHAQIDERAAEYGGSPIYGLAGCINFNAPTDKRCGEEELPETRMHVSTDSWVGGYLPDFEQMQKDFPSIAPEDLGSVGYDGEETMYVSEAVFEAAYSQNLGF